MAETIDRFEADGYPWRLVKPYREGYATFDQRDEQGKVSGYYSRRIAPICRLEYDRAKSPRPTARFWR